MLPVFLADLDNTLIYSYKHNIGPDTIPVERYQGREVSFLTKQTQQLLKKLQGRMLVVPMTTRTLEQYSRIDLGIGQIRYALACNGGMLLVDGHCDRGWLEQSKRETAESRRELERAAMFLSHEKTRTLEVRFIEGLFIFTKCSDPVPAVGHLQRQLDLSLVDVMHHGQKVYVIPKKLSKGHALKRFRAYLGAQAVFAAGDSVFDYSMLKQADLAAAPPSCKDCLDGFANICIMPGNKVFSEELLEFLLREVAVNGGCGTKG